MVQVAVRSVRAHRVRLLSTVIAVLLGVSFMTGTAILADTVRASFDEVFADTYSRIDLLVRGDRTVGAGFGSRRERVPATLAGQLAAIPGVVAAEGQIEAPLRILGGDGRPLYRGDAGPPPIALNWLRTPALNGWTLVAGHPPGEGEVVVDRRTARQGGFALGDPVRLAVATGTVERRLAGVATFAGLDTYNGGPAVVLDTADAQRLVGEPDRFDWVSVVLAPGAAGDAAAARLRAAVPPGTQVLTGAELTRERQDLLGRFVELFTRLIAAFGLIALFVGSFIIANTFAIVVAQRTRELALLRAVGASRRQLVGSVLTEALAVGAVASLLGVVAGVGVARLLRAAIARFGFALPDTPLRLEPGRAVLPLLLGVGVTLVAAALPAAQAARTPPVEALRRAAVDRARHRRVRLLAAVPLVAVALAMMRYAFDLGTDAAAGWVLGAAVPAIGALALAGPVVVPPVADAVGVVFPPLTGITGRLARRNAVRNPRRTSSTACALVIGVSLVAAITIVAASLSATVARGVDRTSVGDFVVTAEGFLGVSPEVARTLATLPEVDTAAGVRAGPVAVKGQPEMAVAVDPAAARRVVDLEVRDGSLDRLGPDTVAVAAPQAQRDGVRVGDRLPVTFVATGEHTVEVVAVYGRSLTRNGEYLFAQSGWDPNVVPSARTDNRVLVTTAAGVDPARARAALERALVPFPAAELLDVGEFRDRQVGQVTRRISYLYALLGLALVIGVLGIVNTLVLSVHERRHEIGLLRAVGTRRRQAGSAVLQEAVLIAVPGAVFGVGLGTVLGWGVVRTLRFDTEVVLAMPVGWLGALGAGACIAGLVAGLYPAWRAGRVPLSGLLAEE